MAAKIIEGKITAEKYNLQFKARAEILKSKGISPCLTVVIAGENPASLSYVRGKKKALAALGMEGRDIMLPFESKEEELLNVIASLNRDKDVHGILVQQPLPPHIKEDSVINAIDPKKDVDCFHPVNLGKLMQGQKAFLPCTPHGIILLLQEENIPIAGSNIVIVGRSNIVGKPLALLLIRKENNATVTVCHTGSLNLGEHTRKADILIAAAGSAGLIKGDMIKEGAAVIDVGVNRVVDSTAKKGYRLKGDVEYKEALEKAGFITPVPGGVGPMTIAMLINNVLEAAEQYA